MLKIINFIDEIDIKKALLIPKSSAFLIVVYSKIKILFGQV